jgi:hypothetical protein
MPGETILVAEHNAEEQEALALALRRRGYTVLPAGIEARRTKGCRKAG